MSQFSEDVIKGLKDFDETVRNRVIQKNENQKNMDVLWTKVDQLISDFKQSLRPAGFICYTEWSPQRKVTIIEFKHAEVNGATIAKTEIFPFATPDGCYILSPAQGNEPHVIWSTADGEGEIPTRLTSFLLDKIRVAKEQSIKASGNFRRPVSL